MHFIVKKRTFVAVSVFEFSGSILYCFIKLALVYIVLCIPYPLAFPKVILKLSLINLVGVDLSSIKILSAVEELTDILDSICLKDSISMKLPTGIPLTDINDPRPVLCLLNKRVPIASILGVQ